MPPKPQTFESRVTQSLWDTQRNVGCKLIPTVLGRWLGWFLEQSAQLLPAGEVTCSAVRHRCGCWDTTYGGSIWPEVTQVFAKIGEGRAQK